MSKGDSTSFTGEENVFFPPGITYPKPNLISWAMFDNDVAKAGMSEALCPRLPIPNEVDLKPPHPVSLPQPGEEFIFPLQIDVGFRFPYCSDLGEICQYYSVYPTQFSPNAIQFWVGFLVLCQQRD